MYTECVCFSQQVPSHQPLCPVVDTEIRVLDAEDKFKNGYIWIDWMCLPQNHLENNLETWNEMNEIMVAGFTYFWNFHPEPWGRFPV